MTGSEIPRISFDRSAVREWAKTDSRHKNWPVVYLLDSARPAASPSALRDVYVGETLNAEARILQHLDNPDKKRLLSHFRVVLDDRFNKSVCLDLESHLIRLLAGDGTFRVLNRNDGITDANYYERDAYRESFRRVFDQLLHEGVFSRSIPEIENSDLFKLSPYKALTTDQAIAVENIVEGLFDDLEQNRGELLVVQGEPGTGKTVIAIYLMKLLADIAASRPDDEPDADSIFSDFFTEGHRALLRDFRVGLVVPQQSLRESIKRVFKRTPGLAPSQVLTPFQVGASDECWDLLIVDEAHRLNQRANQPSGVQNKQFRDITVKLFGHDDHTKTQLDWIQALSRHQVLLVDPEQSVRPADLPPELLRNLVEEAKGEGRHYPLVSQLRVRAGDDYIAWVRQLFSPQSSEAMMQKRPDFGNYELKFFDDLGQMHEEIRERDAQYGLARLVAGYAWEWKSKENHEAYDIELDDRRLRWNSTATEWIASPNSLEEVGSIHTVQGYDLNYAGVIVGNDLRWDEARGRLAVDRASYFDKKGKENNPTLGRKYTDDDLLRYICNVYSVLMTRGIRGTFVYVCDPVLRKVVRTLLSEGQSVGRGPVIRSFPSTSGAPGN
ncbi:DNA/RNA helicase domain-containing protein [Microcella sp.]|uniref:DNA/RNA helicase domain-containing protein n=1 Tax=Microcella sp. TaxID=1913979 RepID=UPI00391D1509